ncbi:MAG: 2Fe-2S iron-sulfur cluster-binding protein [Deltaproteobacteria bacterium]
MCTVESEDGERVDVRVRPDQHLLAALAARGLAVVPVGCRGGGCGVCRVRVLAGDYTCRPMSQRHVSAEARGEGYALACRVYPRGDLVVRCASAEPERDPLEAGEDDGGGDDAFHAG